MQHIYKKICRDKTKKWNYVFEDDINLLKKIKLSEIVKYEKISDNVIYLGLCTSKRRHNKKYHIKTKHKINNHPVYKTNGFTRGLHAIGLSHNGCKKLLQFSMKSRHNYMDCILEEFTKKNPAIVIRYDLQSYLLGHRGIFFQDRRKFPSKITFNYIFDKILEMYIMLLEKIDE